MSRRRCRVIAIAALAFAAVALTGCESRVGTAAVVDGQRITDDQLQSLVRDALAAPGVRAALPNSSFKGDLAAYHRSVLDIRVRRLLVEAAARRQGVVVGEAAVTARYRFHEQTAGGATEFAADQAAREARSPGLVRELVRTEVLLAEIGFKAGGVARPTEASLRRQYEAYATENTRATLSLIQVPDPAAARAALAQVQRDPESFAEVAKNYADQPETAPEPTGYQLSRMPADLRERLDEAKPGETFLYTVSGNGQTVNYVIKFGGISRPSLEESRPQLESESVNAAVEAGQRHVQEVAGQIGIEINPRYGSWDGKTLEITDFINPVVKQTPTPAPGGTGADGGQPPDGSVPEDGSVPTTGG